MTAIRSRTIALAVTMFLTVSPLRSGESSRAPNPAGSIIYDFPQAFPVGEKKISTSVTLRPVTFDYLPPPPLLAVSVLPNTTLKISVNADPSTIMAISWVKDGTPMGITTPTLEIPAVSSIDSGFYGAAITLKNPPPTGAAFETVAIRVVTQPWIRLFNLSTRATLGPSQKFFISGFVISSPPLYDGGGPKVVLIRAIGPSLASYGVSDPLADPVIHVFNSKGAEMVPPPRPDVFPDLALEQIVARAGAFPIARLTKDVTALYSLPGDVYSAKISSASGGSGTVLLEIYEVPE